MAFASCSEQKNQETSEELLPVQQSLKKDDLQNEGLSDLRVKRNEIFARYGYIFKSKELSDYFAQFEWYKPAFANVTDQLTEIDKQNIQLLLGLENAIKAQSISKQVVGQWTSKQYLRTLDRTKSQRASYAQGATQLLHLKESGESLIIFNFHEGISPDYSVEDNRIIFKGRPFQELGAEFIDYYTLIFRNHQTTDTLVRFDVWDAERRNLAINELVFQGKYLDLQTGDTVEFKRNGNVTGIEGFTEYSAFEDYIGPALDLDLLRLKTEDEDLTELTWLSHGDQLDLYSIKCLQYDSEQQECWEIAKDQLLYSLKRINSDLKKLRHY